MKSVIKVSILYQHDYKPVSSENPTERVAAFVSQKYKTHHQFAVKQVALLEAFFPKISEIDRAGGHSIQNQQLAAFCFFFLLV